MNDQLEMDFDAIDKEIAKFKETKNPDVGGTDVETRLLHHKAMLNQKPPAKFLKKNPFYGNDYIPIEILERMLNAIFDTYHPEFAFAPTTEEGNILFYMNVVVTNPVTKQIERYPGVSAVPIKPLNGTLRDIHPHIPAAKSFAIMNACKHIGRLFRAENDKVTEIFDTYFEDKIEEKQKLSPEDDRIIRMINGAKNKTALGKLKKNVPKHLMDKYKEKLDSFPKRKPKPKKK
jgi:hypothetical protein